MSFTKASQVLAGCLQQKGWGILWWHSHLCWSYDTTGHALWLWLSLPLICLKTLLREFQFLAIVGQKTPFPTYTESTGAFVILFLGHLKNTASTPYGFGGWKLEAHNFMQWGALVTQYCIRGAAGKSSTSGNSGLTLDIHSNYHCAFLLSSPKAMHTCSTSCLW